ncbi:CRISPR-associated endonuclease Cas3'' [Spiractinospora alimapuensis]|uniref:CRISPR-associated endonuclease Cas3'' n=1 Tax=Spiractinospora alimapuensis TaxID=2820884 RepID=UPI001F1B1465|nr:CRISPR-associated endonuclease Cas3'' [Spiractinospora alimapuensis]QVQ51551.1 CRISPR-associated endonuclease Cas3'' [Spiractinospora alimapuensis]
MGLTSPDLRHKGKERGLKGAHYPALCHGADVAAVAIVVWRRFVAPGLRATIAGAMGVTEREAERIIAFWAALHDVGKVEPHMQRKLKARLPSSYPAPAGKPVPHDRVGCLWLTVALVEAGYPSPTSDDPLTHLVAQMLGGHHGRYTAQVSSRGDLRTTIDLPEDIWDEQRFAYLAAMRDLLGDPPRPPALDPTTAVLVTGIVVLSDWLASQEHFILERVPASLDDFDLRTHFEGVLRRAPSLLTEAGLDRLRTPPASFAETFPDISIPHALQQSIATHLPRLVTDTPGLLIVTAPTGEGKTEVGLFASDHMGEACGRPGRTFLLPTMATANSMHTRVRDFVRRRADAPAPLMKLHSMAWLDQEFLPASPRPDSAILSSDEFDAALAPTQWLYGGLRALLASWGIGTFDQALLGILPTRHNAVRLFGLAGGSVVVDEAHAVDPYMRLEMEQLLRWFGRFGVPVVLLSATLHRSVADAYARAYLEGQEAKLPRSLPGRRGKKSGREPVVGHLNYPGWVCVTTEDNTPVVTHNPEPITVTERPALTVTTTFVPLREHPSPYGNKTDHELDRVAALGEQLAPVFTSGGCAAVICTTVAEAQATYELVKQLRQDVGASTTELRLLHARFPQRQRDRITEELVYRLGRDGAKDRPASMVLVATAIIEQSLDIDVDHMITDLAPLALLLQRAGRCWRHEAWRVADKDVPVFTRGPFTEPRVSVLTPEEFVDKEELPGAWRAIHGTSLLVRTTNLLREHGEKVRIPEDVQDLVEQVYDADRIRARDEAEYERMAKETAERQQGEEAIVPTPAALDYGADLLRMNNGTLSDEAVTTRLGADSVRVVCCFRDPDGTLWADPEATQLLPGAEPERTRPLTRDEAATVMSLSIPVRGGKWQTRLSDADLTVPTPWQNRPQLERVLLLPHPVTEPGHPTPASLGGRSWFLDPELGLRVDVPERQRH